MRENSKYIKQYESFLGDLRRLDPNKLENDNKARALFDDIIKDFEKHDNDLMKVKIIDESTKKRVSFSKIEFGVYYSLYYVFGKYHSTNNSTITGNTRAGNRHIKITKIPPSLTLNRNKLERAFNTSRVFLGRATVEEIRTTHNYNRNPKIQGQSHLYDKSTEKYTISNNIAKDIVVYFIDEYNKQYPGLKRGRYKGEMGIRDIENKTNPVLKYVEVTTRDGLNNTIAIRKGDNEKQLLKMASKMTSDELGEWIDNRKREIYADLDKKRKNEKEELYNTVGDLLKKYNINYELPSYSTTAPPFHVTRFSRECIRVEYRTLDPTEGDIEGLKRTKLDGLDFTDIVIRKSYKFEEDGMYFVSLIYSE